MSAKNGDFPQFFAKLYGKETPAPMRGLVAQAMLAAMFVLPGNFESLLACFSVAAWIFYLMVRIVRWSAILVWPTLATAA